MLSNAAKQGFMTAKAKELVPVFTDSSKLLNYFENYNPEEYNFSILKKVEN